jgi:hypothetical protein
VCTPDLVLVKASCGNQPARLVFAELKTATGKLTAAQRMWLEVFEQCPGVEMHVWRPGDWKTIVSRLQKRHARACRDTW